MIKKLKIWAKSLKRQVFILYLATKDKRTPWVAKVIAVCVVAYAFSPIDLIPDFIPILGYLDDVIIVPLGIMLAIKLIPEPIISDCKVKAGEMMKNGKPKNWFVGSLIILVWIVLVVWLSTVAYKFFK
ncbi:YkvA family protein [Aneurinibacillus sp. Ricciae_BoGa-3]|uniref:YkvA family protein n=1 Tax=Aneurinibacillus sp. Ricciae_BoGa-3 TaxID=3022697 RepID=UPI0023425241|nr:YkvA family protein [Aneurinibacillus sp. Ricciae_BoGa-3]WCK54892.1 YkvA family protein [Aneurinibacillus sp. Ricciae_BoGa-3]